MGVGGGSGRILVRPQASASRSCGEGGGSQRAALVEPCWPEFRARRHPEATPPRFTLPPVVSSLWPARNSAGAQRPGDRAGLRSNPQMQPTGPD